VVVDRDDFGDVGQTGSVSPDLTDALDGGDHVLGGEVAAVVERHALADVEGVGEAVVRDLPGGGDLRLDAEVFSVADQRLEDVDGDVGGGTCSAEVRIERRRAGEV